MTPRRHRTFLDHKAPMVAFVLIAVASIGLLMHVARSDAAPGWLRDGATVVVSGGSPLTRHVLERATADREPDPGTDAVAVEAPVVAPRVAPPAAGPAREPAHPPRHAAPPAHDGRTTPDLQPTATDEEPEPPTDPSPAHPGKGPNVPTHQAPVLPTSPSEGDDGGRPDPGPIRGSGAEHAHGHPWYGDDWRGDGHDRGHGHDRGRGHESHGHGHGHDSHGHD